MWSRLEQVLPGNKCPLSNRIVSGDTVFTTNKEIAKEVNHFLASIASKLRENVPCGDLPTCPACVPEDTTFEFPPVAEEYVTKQIDIMIPGKACGLDGIGWRLLNLVRPAILKPLTHVFNVSI